MARENYGRQWSGNGQVMVRKWSCNGQAMRHRCSVQCGSIVAELQCARGSSGSTQALVQPAQRLPASPAHGKPYGPAPRWSPHCPSSSSGSSCMESKSGADWLTLSRPCWPGRCRHTPHVAAFVPAAELWLLGGELPGRAGSSSCHTPCVQTLSPPRSGHKFGCRRGRAPRHQRIVRGSPTSAVALVRQLPEVEDGLPEVGPGARGAAVVTEIRV